MLKIYCFRCSKVGYGEQRPPRLNTQSHADHCFGYEDEGKLEMSISTSDIKDRYKDAILLPKWKAFQTIIFLEWDDGLHDSQKIASFDFDGCLAKTSVKRVGADAWSVMYPSIHEKLQNLYNDGYKLVTHSYDWS